MKELDFQVDYYLPLLLQALAKKRRCFQDSKRLLTGPKLTSGFCSARQSSSKSQLSSTRRQDTQRVSGRLNIDYQGFHEAKVVHEALIGLSNNAHKDNWCFGLGMTTTSAPFQNIVANGNIISRPRYKSHSIVSLE